jgi:hypothetical protein
MLGLTHVGLDAMRLGASCLLYGNLALLWTGKVETRWYDVYGVTYGILAGRSLKTRSCIDVTPMMAETAESRGLRLGLRHASNKGYNSLAPIDSFGSLDATSTSHQWSTDERDACCLAVAVAARSL